MHALQPFSFHASTARHTHIHIHTPYRELRGAFTQHSTCAGSRSHICVFACSKHLQVSGSGCDAAPYISPEPTPVLNITASVCNASAVLCIPHPARVHTEPVQRAPVQAQRHARFGAHHDQCGRGGEEGEVRGLCVSRAACCGYAACICSSTATCTIWSGL